MRVIIAVIFFVFLFMGFFVFELTLAPVIFVFVLVFAFVVAIVAAIAMWVSPNRPAVFRASGKIILVEYVSLESEKSDVVLIFNPFLTAFYMNGEEIER